MKTIKSVSKKACVIRLQRKMKTKYAIWPTIYCYDPKPRYSADSILKRAPMRFIRMILHDA